MKKNRMRKAFLLPAVYLMLTGAAFPGHSAYLHKKWSYAVQTDTGRTLAPYFIAPTTGKKTPNPDGFIQRWLLLEPINKPNRTNTVFTYTYLNTAFNTEYFPNQFTILPKDGETVKAGEQELTWHALETNNFNVKLFRFAYGYYKHTYAVLFWAVTVVNSPREMKNVRLAAGSNGASIWWVNSKEALLLEGDRRMVMDDGVSNRLTLNKGKNIIRVALINGPGLSDFCVRFLDEKGVPVKDLTISYQ
ncbi:acetylxylan esterase [Mucilaginibacter sp. PPCGB 2223]|uniref:acetylxylan esterase n=1 Tax=Mucilaginibacter sp. PPCGB 2223 TaxID=1886027 RepID=UPI000A448E34|nr:acetylxylan esterase [Mucilaginibacter sp. PPCGB 2223]